MSREGIARREDVAVKLDAALGYARRTAGEGDQCGIVAVRFDRRQRFERRSARLQVAVPVVAVIFDDLLYEAGLVDRLRVVVFPVITGSTGHDRIYDGYPDVALELVGSRTFDGRLQLLEYVPRVLEGPPGMHRGS